MQKRSKISLKRGNKPPNKGFCHWGLGLELLIFIDMENELQGPRQAVWEEILAFFRDPVLGKVAAGVIGALVILTLVRFLKHFASRSFKDRQAKYRIRKAVGFLGFIATIVMVLIIFEVKLTGVSVALGVAGAGIAFALQEVIVSIAGYISIQTGHFFSVGDRVMLAGIKGDVVDIGVLRTTMMEVGDWVNGDLYNGKMVRIANSFVYKDPVFNYSGDFPFLWDEIQVPVKTISDFEYTERIFTEILEELVGEYAKGADITWKRLLDRYRLEDASVAPMVTISFDENWLTFTLRYVVDFQRRRSTKHQISKAILKAINESDGKIRIASSAIEITAFPPDSRE